MKALGLITVTMMALILVIGTGDFPDWGYPFTPAHIHVSPYYIENTLAQTAVPNIVTAVLADYRGFDTMFETTVIFAAGLACFFLLRTAKRRRLELYLYRHRTTGIVLHIEESGKIPDSDTRFERIDSLWTPHDLIIKTTCRLVIPFIQLFALYVIAHGHYSPGGGFQGGVILGATIILFAVSHDLRTTLNRMSEKASALTAAAGVFVYAGTGLFCIVLGGTFLEYGVLAPLFNATAATARSYGILIVEIGVGMAVMAVMIWLYYSISSAGKHDEGL